MGRFHYALIRHPLLAVLVAIFACMQISAQDSFNQDQFGGFGNQFGIGGGDPVEFSSKFDVFKDSNRGVFTVTAKIQDTWHIYAQDTPKGGPLPSVFTPAKSKEVTFIGPFVPTEKPEIALQGKVEVYQFGHEVTWQALIEFADGVDPKSVEIVVGYEGQRCDPNGCLPFDAELIANYEETIEPMELAMYSGQPDSSAKESENDSAEPDESTDSNADGPAAGDQLSRVQAFNNKLEVQGSDAKKQSVFAALGLAILGGFVLNFMPCVLPVIGLKILSFVQQAGANRRQAFMLNLWYSLGLLSVFMVLATLAALFSFGWGQQAQYTWFNVTMVAVLFVMGLSFLGVWEIPIPGFVGSSSVSKQTEKEGAVGAFLKGIITTILAVPCSGPGIATALAWSAGQPPYLVYLVFFAMALGMAFPYIVIGMFPQLVRFLPKPGAWMETFKEVMGFALLGTVVFLFTYIEQPMIIPTLAFVVALWFACWLIGRIPFTASAGTKYKYWGTAIIFSVVMGFITLWGEPIDLGFTRVTPVANITKARHQLSLDKHVAEMEINKDNRVAVEESDDEIHWKPFTLERLEQELAKGNTVMVDFTADW